MQELIAKLEAASEGSREFDADIEKCIKKLSGAVSPAPGWLAGPVTGDNPIKAAYYTTSLNAALTLVPEGFAVESATIWPGKPSGFVIVGTHEFRGERWHSSKDGRWLGEGATPALALTIAALKARAS